MAKETETGSVVVVTGKAVSVCQSSSSQEHPNRIFHQRVVSTLKDEGIQSHQKHQIFPSPIIFPT